MKMKMKKKMQMKVMKNMMPKKKMMEKMMFGLPRPRICAGRGGTSKDRLSLASYVFSTEQEMMSIVNGPRGTPYCDDVSLHTEALRTMCTGCLIQ